MSRYFFDVYDDDRAPAIDASGMEFGDLAAVRAEARRLLPELALAEIAGDGDRRSFVVVVRNEVQRTIYSATLTYTGLWHRG